MNKVEDYKREILFIFFSQIEFILKIASIIFIGSILIAFFWTPTYAAYGSFLLKSKEIQKSPTVIETMDIKQESLKEEDLASEIEILISHNTIEKTLKLLAKNNPGKGYGEIKPSNIRSDLKTEILPTSNVIKVEYYSNNADFAKEFLITYDLQPLIAASLIY